MDLQKRFLKERLTKAVDNLGTNETLQKKFLKDCLVDFGYLDISPEDDYTEDDYGHIIPTYLPPSVSSSIPSIPLENEETLFASIQGLKGPQFTRTFLQSEENKPSRLEKVQQRGIDTVEAELAKINELYTSVIEKINLNEPDRVKQFALNMYNEILTYYVENIHHFPINKGSLKKGYIILCLYYSLVQFNYYITHQRLVNLFGLKFSVADIPDAEKYLVTFNKYTNLFSSNIQERNMCNMRTVLNGETIRQIENVIKNVHGLFGNPLNSVQIAACIYLVTNKINGRIKITNEEGIPSFVTYELISKNCDGNPSRKPIEKAVSQMIDFFDKNPTLL